VRGVEARSPTGTVWTVRRRWLPHREGHGVKQRFRNDRTEGGLDGLDLPIDLGLDIAGLVIGIVIFVVLGIVLVFGWPLILLGLDLAWLIVVAGVGAIARIVLGRPWRVEATSDSERREWYVKGFGTAGDLRDHLANQFQHGQNPSPDQPTQLSN
jgi:hypothetical protein